MKVPSPRIALSIVFVALLVAGALSAPHRPAPGLMRPAGGLVALVGATVIDGSGAAPIERCTILLEGERIRAVGRDLVLPAGTESIDVAGKTIVPGLIDMHGHLFTNLGGTFRNELVPFARLYLAGGVTTIFTAGEELPEEALEFRDAQRAGDEVGTRIYSPGPYFNHTGGEVAFQGGLDGPESARALFAQWKGRIDGIKVYMDITPEEFSAVVSEAHAAGLRVTGHLGSLTATQAVELGIDRLEHGLYAMSEFGRPNPARPFDVEYLSGLADAELETGPGAAMIEAIVAHGTVLDPTVVVLESLFAGPLELTPDWKRYLSPDAERAMQQMYRALASMRAAAAPAEEWNELVQRVLDKQRELVRRVHEKGGRVVAGTDPVFADILPGYGLHREAQHLVLAGMTPLEALRACTRNAAEALGLEQELGSIAPGLLADLVVLAEDPSQDIRALGSTVEVWQSGTRYSPDELRASVVGAIE